MTKEELLTKIKEIRSQNNKFEGICDIGLSPNVAFREWLDSVEQDLANDLIPDRFINILSHNLDDLELPRLSIIFLARDDYYKEEYKQARNQVNFLSVKYENAYRIYRAIDYAKQNVVVVGANGSGKTTLANTLRETLNRDDGIVIPAQKLLLVPTFSNIPVYGAVKGLFDEYQRTIIDDKRTYTVKDINDIPYEITQEYGSEYKTILALLIAERNKKRNEFFDNKKDGTLYYSNEIKTTIDTVIEIWNDLITHRQIAIDTDSNLFIKYKVEKTAVGYEAYRMSDGERIILYLVGRIMQAPRNGLIIVDEPELYLHKTVAEKLWSRLEKERKDCTFIYMTHDLQFASSRLGIKSWIRSYDYPFIWQIQRIEDNEIPEPLLMEILGSCKNTLFCEGKPTDSLDKKIFEILFPDFAVYPVGSCKEVINYTKAFNAIPNVNSNAFGIVDCDFRTKEEINNLKTHNVYSYDVAEIENIFLEENFLKAFKEHHRFNGEIENIKRNIISMLDRNKETQVSNYVSAQIDYYYKNNHISKGNTKEEILRKKEVFDANIKIEEWYTRRAREIERIVNCQDYLKAISVYNNKGLHRIVEQEWEIKNYNKKALEYLIGAPETVINELRRLFPKELFKGPKNAYDHS